ncbi:MAG: hypothetical protein IPM80_05575 [Proteobacteria bacterium]|nr:hypothetical protein [Pseudomonadota bacterium]
MSTRYLGERYEYLSENRVEQYGGDINIYVRWEKHLMFACPSAYRVPTAMRLGDFLEHMLKPDYAAHPDCAALDSRALRMEARQGAVAARLRQVHRRQRCRPHELYRVPRTRPRRSQRPRLLSAAARRELPADHRAARRDARNRGRPEHARWRAARRHLPALCL